MRMTWILSAICFAALNASAQEGASRQYSQPLCASCAWNLTPGESVWEALGDTSLWFGRIAAAVFDGESRLYVADGLRHSVLRLDLTRSSVKAIGREGEGPGEFRLPFHVAVLPDGRLLVYDLVLHRFSTFDSTGRYTAGFRAPVELPRVESMAVDHDGHIYISARSSAARHVEPIYQLDLEGDVVATFAEPFPDDLGGEGGRGGELWWHAADSTLWFSRKGSRVELVAFGHDGEARRRIKIVELARPEGDVEMTTSGSRVTVRPRARPGTIAVFGFGSDYLVNVARANETGDMRYDVLRATDGAHLASWKEDSAAPVWDVSDGERWVIALAEDVPDVLRSRATLSLKGQP